MRLIQPYCVKQPKILTWPARKAKEKATAVADLKAGKPLR